MCGCFHFLNWAVYTTKRHCAIDRICVRIPERRRCRENPDAGKPKYPPSTGMPLSVDAGCHTHIQLIVDFGNQPGGAFAIDEDSLRKLRL